MFLHTQPINVENFERAFPVLNQLWETIIANHSPEALNYVKGGMLIHVRSCGSAPTMEAIERWIANNRFREGHSAWVTIRTILELNGYRAQYPKRMGGKYTTREMHPLYNYPWSFSLEITNQQLDWLKRHGWIITKKE